MKVSLFAVVLVIVQSSPLSSPWSVWKRSVAASPSVAEIESVSVLVTTFPVPFGVIVTLPFESVDDISLPSSFKLSTLKSVTAELVPIVTASIAPESILTFVVACEPMFTAPENVVTPATVNAPTIAVVELATVACGVKTI